jgi:hypothetical protein
MAHNMQFDYKVIDDFIPLSLQEEIKKILIVDREFPWFYVPDVTYGDKASRHTKTPAPAFSHALKYQGNFNSQFLSHFSMLAHLGAQAADFKFKEIAQARTFLQLPLSKSYLKQSVDRLHCDLDEDHLVVLYYVVDSDGDTIIVNKKMDLETREENLEYQNYDILAKVTPKQGRVVLFDGKLYHTAEQPKNNIRCVINIDVI